MSDDSTNNRIQEIERELSEKRELLETLEKSMESMSDDPDIQADIGAHTAARLRRTKEDIEQLEESLRKHFDSSLWPE